MESSGAKPYVGHLKKGDIVQVPIPFDDKEGESKVRPALILIHSDGDSYMVCSITSKPNRLHKILIERKDLKSGKIGFDASFVRPNLIHTINRKYILRKLATLKDEKMLEVTQKIMELMNLTPEEEPAKSLVFERPKAPNRIR